MDTIELEKRPLVLWSTRPQRGISCVTKDDVIRQGYFSKDRILYPMESCQVAFMIFFNEMRDKQRKYELSCAEKAARKRDNAEQQAARKRVTSKVAPRNKS